MTFHYIVGSILLITWLIPVSSPAAKQRKRDRWPAMLLENVNTRQKATVKLYDRRGRTVKAAVRKIDHLMRCHHTNRKHRIHWRLVRNLYKISRHYKGRTIKIYSGYRVPQVARLKKGFHTRGMAIDLQVQGVSNTSLRDYLLRTFKQSGVGYYPNSSFVHFDVRGKRAFWVDLSGRGEEPRYVRNPLAYLRRRGSAATRTAPLDTTRKVTKVALVDGPLPLGPAPLKMSHPPRSDSQRNQPSKQPAKDIRGPVSNLRSAP